MGSLQEQNAAHLAANKGVAAALEAGMNRARERDKTFVQLWHGPDGVHVLQVDNEVVAMVAGATAKLEIECNSSTRRVDLGDMHPWPPEES